MGWWPGWSEGGCDEAVAVAVGFHVLPKEAQVLRCGICVCFLAAPPQSVAGVTGQCRLCRRDNPQADSPMVLGGNGCHPCALPWGRCVFNASARTECGAAAERGRGGTGVLGAAEEMLQRVVSRRVLARFDGIGQRDGSDCVVAILGSHRGAGSSCCRVLSHFCAVQGCNRGCATALPVLGT